MSKYTEPQERQAVLTATRQLKMAQSTHAYVRGNTARFYQWLEASSVSDAIPQGPAIWICGDCHLGNMGPLADSRGEVAMQIRDLDQTVIGNPAHDLVRLALSLQTAVRGSDLPGVVSAAMIEAMADAYEAAFLPEADDAPAAVPEPESTVVRVVRRRAMRRRWKHLARERIADARPTIPLGRKYWPITADERAALMALMEEPAVRHLAMTAFGSPEDSVLTIHDAAYWRKGCSSLGLVRYAVLVGIRDRDDENGDGRERLGLMDVKEAVASVAPHAPGVTMPDTPADRVVAGARALSPNLGERIAAGTMLGKSVFVRELMPQDLKIEVEQFSRKEAIASARYLAGVVGKAHARQMDASTRAEWHATLADSHGPTLDAPRWLWRAVVELAALHEAGYLEHCRAYALGDKRPA